MHKQQLDPSQGFSLVALDFNRVIPYHLTKDTY